MKTKVLIVGGGIGGLALANLLAKSGLEVIIIEKRSFPIPDNPDFYGRTAALMGASINILKALDVWGQIKDKTAPLKTMRIIDDSNPKITPVEIDFPASEINKDYFGHNIPNMMLHKTLGDQAMHCQNITVISPATLNKFDVNDSNVTATLDNGHKITADLIIGADGRESKVRELANIASSEEIYDQSAITCLIKHSKPHKNISTEHHRTGGPFTTVPMPDQNGEHFSSVVWVEKQEDADNYIKMNKQALENAIEKRSRSALGEIQLASTPECWPLKGIIAEKIISNRIALIAEAAHVMSPIGAQGLNLSLRDVATLSEIIIDAARLGEDIGSNVTLAKYAKRRNIDITTRFKGVDGYNRIVSNNIGLLRGLRRVGLKSLKNIPAFKQLAMQQGLSPAMDEGRLMRGESL